MNTFHIDEFIVLSQCSSFVEAAAKLNISQSKLSKHIAKLEEETGTKLVTRTNPIGLTSAGRIFFDGARSFQSDLSETLQKCRSAEKNLSGEIAIRSYPLDIHIQKVLMRTMDLFVYKYPSIKISIVENAESSGIYAIKEGLVDIDYHFSYGEMETAIEALAKQGYEAEPIVRTFDTIAMRNDHPLAAKESIHISDLRNTAIMYNSLGVASKSLKDSIESMCSEAGFEALFNNFSLPNASEFLMLDPGMAVYLLPGSTKSEQINARPSMTTRPFDCVSGSHRFWGFFVFKKDSENNALPYLTEILHDQCPLAL